MKSISNHLYLFLFLILPFTSFAINASGIAELKKRKLVVCIKSENKSFLDSIKNDTALVGRYKRSIQSYNENFKRTVQKHWSYHKSFECKTKEEVDKIKFSADDYRKYVVLDIMIIEVLTVDQFGKHGTGERRAYLYLGFAEAQDRKWIAYARLGQVYADAQDFIYGIQNINYNLIGEENGKSEMKLLKESAHRLKGKIILIDSSQIEANVIAMQGIAQLPVEVKVVSKNEVRKAIINGDSKYAYILLINHGSGVWTKRAILCEDSYWVGYAPSEGFTKLNFPDLKRITKGAK
jgi:hypothetical protein